MIFHRTETIQWNFRTNRSQIELRIRHATTFTHTDTNIHMRSTAKLDVSMTKKTQDKFNGKNGLLFCTLCVWWREREWTVNKRLRKLTGLVIAKQPQKRTLTFAKSIAYGSTRSLGTMLHIFILSLFLSLSLSEFALAIVNNDKWSNAKENVSKSLENTWL